MQLVSRVQPPLVRRHVLLSSVPQRCCACASGSPAPAATGDVSRTAGRGGRGAGPRLPLNIRKLVLDLLSASFLPVLALLGKNKL